MENEVWVREEYTISTDKKKLDIFSIYEFLATTYWAKNRSFEIVKNAIENCLCFGVYKNNIQIGFARILTDYSTISYIFDLYILPSYQKLGLGKWLVQTILDYHLIRATHIALATKDKHKFYERVGFKKHEHPDRIMVLTRN